VTARASLRQFRPALPGRYSPSSSSSSSVESSSSSSAESSFPRSGCRAPAHTASANSSRGTLGRIRLVQRLCSAINLILQFTFHRRFACLSRRLGLLASSSPRCSGAREPLRKRAGVQRRLHDLRHTAETKMAEAGVPESTMLALLGHMSRAMMDRYSHIRMAAKREAVEALTIRKESGNSEGVPTKSTTPAEVTTIR
jgi:hypothetical protein